ncbi:hypothetical protein WHI96_17680 [Pseudonocardia tropica]|uniref:HPr kinase/phosphorylase n=1 Tax=Pseudonocardia tropica TaxID=681289 RepID=A0ABV1JY97_9PSEU
MTGTAHRYAGHGLVVESDLELALQRIEPGAGRADIRLTIVPAAPVPDTAPQDAVMAELRDDNGALRFAVSRDDARIALRYPGLCEFVGDPLLREITVRPDPGADPGLLAVLGSGALIAMHLTLNGALVLHASCVEVGGEAVAFVGSSGMGKSTLAAMLCGAGHAFVSDDVLRTTLGPAGSRVLVHAGGVEGRLRDKARSIAATVDGATTAETADGRLALRATLTAASTLPLRACVVPRPTPDAEKVKVTRLGPAAAMRRLLQFPRIVGWTDPTILRDQFQHAADLAERVPVYEAVVPWGPPFDGESTSRQLLGQLS